MTFSVTTATALPAYMAPLVTGSTRMKPSLDHGVGRKSLKRMHLYPTAFHIQIARMLMIQTTATENPMPTTK